MWRNFLGIRHLVRTISIIMLTPWSISCTVVSGPDYFTTRDHTALSSGISLYYVDVYPLGPRIGYETGVILAPSSQLDTEFESHRFDTPVAQAKFISRFADVTVTGPSPYAAETAEIVGLAIDEAIQWFPDTFSDRFEIAVTLIPEGPARFVDRSFFARSPWPMAFQARYDQVVTAERRAMLANTIAHESYHLANSITRDGQLLDEFNYRPAAGRVYEETAALLIGSCVELKLGHVPSLRLNPTVSFQFTHPRTSETRAVSAPFPSDVTSFYVDALSQAHRREDLPNALLYLGFYRTLFSHYADGNEVIEPSTPSAERLVAACDRLGPDIRQVPAELLEVGTPAASPDA